MKEKLTQAQKIELLKLWKKQGYQPLDADTGKASDYSTQNFVEFGLKG